MGYGNFRGGSSSSGNGGRRFGGGGGFRRSFGPREMTKIKCSTCGKEDEVPFKPREGTPVYCKDCYFKSKGMAPRSEKPKAEASEDAELAEEDSEEFGDDSEEESKSEAA